MTTLIKENVSLGLAYRFRDLVLYHQGGKQGSIQADTVLEEPIVQSLDPSQPGGSSLPYWMKREHWETQPYGLGNYWMVVILPSVRQLSAGTEQLVLRTW